MSEIEQSLAIVIGIDNYANVPTLTSAVNDANKLAEILENKTTYGYKVLKLLEDRATYQHLSDLIENLKQGKLQLENELVELDKNARLLFYFAGHGIANDSPEGEERPEGFLVPQDAQLNADNSKLLSMQMLHDALVRVPCHHLLIILDCCFAGSFRWTGLHRNAVRFESTKVYLERYRRFIEKRAQQVITSAAYNQKAFDSIYRFGRRANVGGHSPFAELLFEVLTTKADSNWGRGKDKYLAAIAEDGVVTATELYAYLHQKLYDHLKDTLGQAADRQTPGFCQLRHHEEGEYIFPLAGFKESALATAKVLSEKLNPYMGLNAFEEGDRELFFGRKTLAEELSKVVTAQSLTVVLGASGSGKSSLVKAGLIPYLKAQQEQWSILAPIRPGESPLSALNSTLAKENLPLVSVPTEFSEERQTLSASVATWRDRYPDAKLLLVLDQFEELVTLCRNEREREQFLQSLANALKTYPEQLRVVLTLRSDFEPQIRENVEPHLERNPTSIDDAMIADWIKARFMVPAMTREELREAIEEPAAVRVVFFESSKLVDQLIDEVANMPGALPLLSFALSELFLISLKSGRNDRTITWKDYEDLGGVARSLTQRADHIYNTLLEKYPTEKENYERTVRNIMLRLVSLGGGALARRRISSSELEYPEPEKERVKEVVKCFVEARLLIEGQDIRDGQDNKNQQYIEPAHDALVKGWSKLQDWKQKYEERLVLQQRLTPQAVDWARNEHAKEYLWIRDPRLIVLEATIAPSSSDISNTLENWLNQLETEFVRESIKQKRLEIAKLEEDLRISEERRQLADARRLAAQAELLRNQQPDLLTRSVLLAVEAMKRSQSVGVRSSDIDRTLRNGSTLLPRLTQNLRIDFDLDRVVFSSDGRYIAINEKYQTDIQVWDLINGQPVAFANQETIPNPEGSQLQEIRFGSQSELLIIMNNDRTMLWEVGSSKPIVYLNYGYFAKQTILSHDSKYLAATDDNGTIQVWDITNGQTVARINQESSLKTLVFSPDRQYLATISYDNVARIWEISSGRAVAQIKHEPDLVNVLFSPDSAFIVTTTEGSAYIHLDSYSTTIYNAQSTIYSPKGNNTVWVWEVPSGRAVNNIKHEADLMEIVFSAENQCYLATSGNSSIQVWEASSEQKVASLNHESAVEKAVFSFDLSYVATVTENKTIRVWEVATSRELLRFDSKLAPKVIAFSPNNQYLLVVSSQENSLSQASLIQVWFIIHGQEVIRLTECSGETVLFSPDSQHLLTHNGGYSDQIKAIQFWELASSSGTVYLDHNPYIQGDSTVRSFIFSLDGEYVITKGPYGFSWIWEISSGKEVLKLLNFGDETAAKFASFSPNYKYIAMLIGNNSLRDRQTVQVLDIVSSQVIAHFSIAPIVDNVFFNPDGTYLAAISRGKTIQVWGTKDWNEVATLSHEDLTCAAFNPNDSKYLVTGGGDRLVRVWEVVSRHEVLHLEHEEPIEAVAFSPDGTYIAATSINLTLVWEWQNPENVVQLNCGNTRGNGLEVTFSPNGRYFVVTKYADFGPQKSVQIREVTSRKPAAFVHRDFLNSPRAYAVAFSSDGKYIATADGGMYGGGLSSARVWDTTNGKQIAQFSHDAFIWDVAFSPDSKYLATASDDRTARVWEITSGQEIVNLPHQNSVWAVSFNSGNSKYLVTANPDQIVRSWLWQPHDLINDACARLARNMMMDEWRQYFGNEAYCRTCQNLPIHETFFGVGILAAQSGSVEEATDIFRRWKDLDPTLEIDPEAAARKIAADQLITEASLAVGNGAIKDAICHLQEAVQVDPNLIPSPETNDNYEIAQAVVKHSRALTGEYASLDTLFRKYDDRAIKFRQFLAIDLKHAPEAMARRLEAEAVAREGRNAAEFRGDYQEAVANLQKAKEIDPTLDLDPDTEARKLAAATLLRQGQSIGESEGDVQGAFAKFREAQELEPTINLDLEAEIRRLAPYIAEKGRKLGRLEGDVQGAIAKFREALELDPMLDLDLDAEIRKLAATLVQNGKSLIETWGDSLNAVSKFWQARKLDPTVKLDLDFNLDEEARNLAPVLVERGKSLAQNGNVKGALWDLTTALEWNPTLDLDPDLVIRQLAVPTLVNEAESLALWREDFKGAVVKLQEVSKLDPTLNLDPEAEVRKLEAQVLIRHGTSFASQGELESAIAKFQTALDLDASLDLNPELEARKYRAVALIQEGLNLARYQQNIQKAISVYTEAKTLDPAVEISANDWNILCWYGSLNGYASDVFYACEQAVTLEPENITFRDSRGLARAMTGDIEGAIADFEAFVAQTSNDEEKLQRQRWIEALRSGENSFTPEEIERLRSY